MNHNFNSILIEYDLNASDFIIEALGNGLINETFGLRSEGGSYEYVLQKINTSVFSKPEKIASNYQCASDFLKSNNADYFFLPVLKTKHNQYLSMQPETGVWRLMPFVKDSISFDVATKPKQAFSAASQFARLTRMLDGINPANFHDVIPEFHNLLVRFKNFKNSVTAASIFRLKKAAQLIEFYNNQNFIVSTYESILNENKIPLRIQHNDTKINNVLYSKSTNEAICVIDLDTLMPGFFIYDLGDMIRTYTCAADENETDFEKVVIRPDFYAATIEGYLSEMKSVLTNEEISLIPYAGQMMIYIMGLRFLTDYLMNDVYYKIKYDEHNLNRAANQMHLLTSLQSLLQKVSTIQ